MAAEEESKGPDVLEQAQQRAADEAASRLGQVAKQRTKKLFTRKAGKQAAKTATKATAKKATKTVAKQGIKRSVQGLLTALGSEVPVIGNAVMALIGEVVGEIIARMIMAMAKFTKDVRDFLGGVSIAAAQVLSIVVPKIIIAVSVVGGTLLSPFLIAVGVVIFAAFMAYIMTASSWVVPPWEGAFGPNPYDDSIYIEVIKTPSPKTRYDNSELPTVVTFNITVIAEQSALTNIQISATCRVNSRHIPNLTCPALDPGIPQPGDDGYPISIVPGSPYTFSYTQSFDTNYSDSIVFDTITVTASVEGLTESSTGSASVIFGNPPLTCPSDWPTDTGTVTRGPYSVGTHLTAEAIDIGLLSGNTVTVTHSGTVVRSETDPGGIFGGFGEVIEVQSVCFVELTNTTVPFISRYAHLSARFVAVGDPVEFGDTIGASGNTGNTTGPHLHYEFRIGTTSPGTPAGPWPGNPPTMDIPWLPVDAHGCGNNCGFIIQ